MRSHQILPCLAAVCLFFPLSAQEKSAREPGLYATIKTTMGELTFRLFEKEAPQTVKNFVELTLGHKEWTNNQTGERTSRPFYKGLSFHRVIKGFMIQTGDYTGKGNGTSDVIPDEVKADLKFDVPGRVAMANSGPNTATCQFFITEVPTPHLDGTFTIFGQVVDGQDLVSKIAAVETGPEDRPIAPVLIENIRFERVGPAPGNDILKSSQ